jgi:5'(3')-deoxyribonucleotidase
MTDNTIFIDMDGVLSDFNQRWFEFWEFDTETIRQKMTKEEMWRHTHEIDPFFFERLKPMPDAFELVSGVSEWAIDNNFDVAILTGSPAEWGYLQKFRWGREHFPNIPTIVCKSKEKHFYCTPGDILIDDRTKYMDLWVNSGGTFIVHKTAKESLERLQRLYNPAKFFTDDM